MVTGCFRAAICSQEEGAEKGGCGCCIQDGAQPCRLWLWFFPLFPHLASHSCWENVFTHVWGSRRCQILTATKNTLETNLFLPPRQGVQEASLPTEQEEKITGERVTGQHQQFHRGSSSGSLGRLRIRPTKEVEKHHFFFFSLTVQRLFFRHCIRWPICLSLLTHYRMQEGSTPPNFLNYHAPLLKGVISVSRHVCFYPSFLRKRGK